MVGSGVDVGYPEEVVVGSGEYVGYPEADVELAELEDSGRGVQFGRVKVPL